jgi:hypothetical protein
MTKHQSTRIVSSAMIDQLILAQAELPPLPHSLRYWSTSLRCPNFLRVAKQAFTETIALVGSRLD